MPDSIRVELFGYLIPGIKQILKANGCEYRRNYQDPFHFHQCCFKDIKIDINKEKVEAMAANNDYTAVCRYIKELAMLTLSREIA